MKKSYSPITLDTIVRVELRSYEDDSLIRSIGEHRIAELEDLLESNPGLHREGHVRLFSDEFDWGYDDDSDAFVGYASDCPDDAGIGSKEYQDNIDTETWVYYDEGRITGPWPGGRDDD